MGTRIQKGLVLQIVTWGVLVHGYKNTERPRNTQIVTWGSLVHCTDGLVLQFVTRTHSEPWSTGKRSTICNTY